MNREHLVKNLANWGLDISSMQLDQFDQYADTLINRNKRINLTAIKDVPSIYTKHFLDSLSLATISEIKGIRSMIDIGSGAGFPSLPIKIMIPSINLTILDSLRKRVDFLKHVTNLVQLDAVSCIHARAEEAARVPLLRDSFDLVTARAVARLPLLIELCIPFVRKDGFFVAMKGPNSENELQEASFALSELNAKHVNSYHFILPDEENSKRSLLVFKKLKETPKKYPRKAGVPEKLPLME